MRVPVHSPGRKRPNYAAVAIHTPAPGDAIKRFLHTLALFLCIAALVGGCLPRGAADPDPVRVQLKWVHQAQFAGFYVADALGYYADEKLDVTLLPGGVGVDLFQGVREGAVEFSVVGADRLIVERAGGLPAKAIATTYRINPFVLVALADSGIASPRDLVGRTVSLSGGYDQVQYLAMLHRLGIDPDDVHVVPYDQDSSALFVQGELDVINSFAAGSLIPLREEVGDRGINLIWPGDYGVHFYSDTIIAGDDLLSNDPDLVLRFLRATLKGHRHAVEHPEDAIETAMRYVELQDRAQQEAMLRASIPLIHTGRDPIGWMDPGVWQEMHDALLDQGFLKEATAQQDLYTTAFLEQVYGAQP